MIAKERHWQFDELSPAGQRMWHFAVRVGSAMRRLGIVEISHISDSDPPIVAFSHSYAVFAVHHAGELLNMDIWRHTTNEPEPVRQEGFTEDEALQMILTGFATMQNPGKPFEKIDAIVKRAAKEAR